MVITDIQIRGAREHNLKNVDVRIQRETLTVVTGLSGSGKSSLAFDTLYAEAHRRYVESLSSYARQFLGVLDKPDVDAIDGLSPAISIEQKTISHNPRSTVGTITEIYDHLRLLYARAGQPTCHRCGKPICRQTAEEIATQIMAIPEPERFMVLAPVVSGRKGEHRERLHKLRQDGFVRVVIDGNARSLDEEIRLAKTRKHTIEVIVDRLKAGRTTRARVTDSVETALKLSGNGTVIVERVAEQDSGRRASKSGARTLLSERMACIECGVSIEELSPRMFSFNSPFGACDRCKGLGYLMELDPGLVAPDPSRSLEEGAIIPWNGAATPGSWNNQIQHAVCEHFGIPRDVPFGELGEQHREILLHGTGKEKIDIAWTSRSGEGQGMLKRPFEGVVPNLLRRHRQTTSDEIRRWIEGFMSRATCPECAGTRLRPESRAVHVGGRSISDLNALSIGSLKAFFECLELSERDRTIARPILKEIIERLSFLVDVGVPYLSLGRMASSISGGEAQRIRLATQIGSKLSGVIYILDEPSIGLHARDNQRLLSTLRSLRDLGNTVVVIEHDRETILSADWVIDMGPGAGVEGGHVVACGTPAELMRAPSSVTGPYLAGRRAVPTPAQRRSGSGASLILHEATGHNLKAVDLHVPLGTLLGVTGVSGSGKSSLVNRTLYLALARRLYRAKTPPLPHGRIDGLTHINKVIGIDQSPIGRTPRSNPATYTKTFDLIRNLFAMLPESKMRGYTPSRFSFNVKGGRCEVCQGDGVKKIEMHFLPDLFVECEACHGQRYNRETLAVTYKGRSIAEVLDLTVDEALALFEHLPSIASKLSVVSRVGLGYLGLGQPATTLSGGEAQRIKLATELAKRSTGKTLYILDEPTTGLHFEDIVMLMQVLQDLVDLGNTVIVIEHNLDVIKCVDHIVDLGPDGGDAGGRIIACGTPEALIEHPESLTGAYLRRALSARPSDDG